jgi:hypothetical protein
MRIFSLALLLAAAGGCTFAADLPTAPTPPAGPQAGTPITLELAIAPGVGDQGGTAAIGVRVLDPFGAPVSGLEVALTSSAGTVTPPVIATDVSGRGASTLAAPPGSVIVSASITNGPTRSAPVAIQPVPPPPPPSTPMPPPGPTPPLPVPPLTVALLVTARQAGFASSFSLATQAITSATWTFGDGGISTTTDPFTTHIYSVAGTYEASVTVVDMHGRTASATQTLTIAAAPK